MQSILINRPTNHVFWLDAFVTFMSSPNTAVIFIVFNYSFAFVLLVVIVKFAVLLNNSIFLVHGSVRDGRRFIHRILHHTVLGCFAYARGIGTSVHGNVSPVHTSTFVRRGQCRLLWIRSAAGTVRLDMLVHLQDMQKRGQELHFKDPGCTTTVTWRNVLLLAVQFRRSCRLLRRCLARAAFKLRAVSLVRNCRSSRETRSAASDGEAQRVCFAHGTASAAKSAFLCVVVLTWTKGELHRRRIVPPDEALA
jgi:hypothetical protein